MSIERGISSITEAAAFRFRQGDIPFRPRSWALAAAFYSAVLVILFWHAIFQGSILYPVDILFAWPPWNAEAPAGWQKCANCLLSDQVQQFYPYAQYRRERLSAGQMPLWDPYALSGTPFVASPQSAIFYPINLLTLAVPLGTSFVVSAFLRLFIAGFFTYVFGRQIGLPGSSALFSGLAFMLSAYNVVWLGYPHSNAVVFLPVVLLFVLRVVAVAAFPNVWPLALAVGFMLLGGHPETVLHSAVLVVSFAVVVSIRKLPTVSRWKILIRRAAAIALGGILGVGFSAIQVLPFIDFLLASPTLTIRNAAAQTPGHLPISTSATFFASTFFGSPVSGLFWGPLDFNEICGYVGLLTVCLALASIADIRQDWRVVFFVAIGVFALFVAYGVSPILEWFTAIPGYREAANQRMLFISEFCLAILAGIGLEIAVQHSPIKRKVELLPFTFGIGGSTILSAIAFSLGRQATKGILDSLITQSVQNGPTVRHEQSSTGLWFGLMFGLAIAVLGLPLLHRKGRFVALAAPIFLAVDLLVTWSGYNPAIPSSWGYKQVPPGVQFLQRQPGYFRIVGINFPTLAPDASTVYGLADIRGYDTPTLRRYFEFFSAMIGPTDGLGYNVVELTPRTMKFLSLLGVRYVLGPHHLSTLGLQEIYAKDISIYKNDHALPRAFFISQAKVLPTKEALQALRDPSFDPTKKAIVETEPDETIVARIAHAVPLPSYSPPVTIFPTPGTPGTPKDLTDSYAQVPSATVRYTEIQPELILLNVNAPKSGYVVVANSYDAGWHALINGRQTTVLPCDVALQAIQVPSGISQIVLWYLPASYVLGIAVTGISGVGIVVIAIATELGHRVPDAPKTGARWRKRLMSNEADERTDEQ